MVWYLVNGKSQLQLHRLQRFHVSPVILSLLKTITWWFTFLHTNCRTRSRDKDKGNIKSTNTLGTNNYAIDSMHHL